MRFRIPRHSDEFLINALMAAAQGKTANNWNLHIRYQQSSGANTDETFPISLGEGWQNQLDKKPLTRVSVKAKLSSAHSLFIHDPNSGACVTVERKIEDPFDTVTVNISGGNLAIHAEIAERLAERLGGCSESVPVNTALGKELGNFVTSRDAALARLEELLARFTTDLATYRKQADDAIVAGNQANKKLLTDERSELQAEFAAKTAKLKADQDALEKRLAEIDDRDSRHARRALREKIIEELRQRSITFQLTKGTQSLRTPVAIVLGLAGTVFLAGSIWTAITANELLTKESISSVALGYIAIKQLAFTGGFISVLWYAIKWSDRWFREHADEEFRAKAMLLDVERANWVVETVMDAKETDESRLPPGLIERLTRNLFAARSAGGPEAEGGRVAISDLLGSASKIKAKVGEAAEFEFDHKGAKKLSESAD